MNIQYFDFTAAKLRSVYKQLLALFLASFFVVPLVWASCTTPSCQVSALNDLYIATTGGKWTHSGNWGKRRSMQQ
jgi:hypothetical protein